MLRSLTAPNTHRFQSQFIILKEQDFAIVNEQIDTQILDISSEAIELLLRQEPEMDTRGTETSATELTLRLVDVDQTID